MTAGPGITPRRSVLRWFLAAVLAMPLIEIIVLVAVGRWIGFWWTIALVIGTGVLGVWLSRRETGRTLRSLQAALDSGRMPTREATDTILVTAGGVLLVLPGFVSDLFGLFLVLPFTRPAARRLLQALVARQAAKLGGTTVVVGQVRRDVRRDPGRGQVIEGEIIAEEPGPGQGVSGPPALGD